MPHLRHAARGLDGATCRASSVVSAPQACSKQVCGCQQQDRQLSVSASNALRTLADIVGFCFVIEPPRPALNHKKIRGFVDVPGMVHMRQLACYLPACS
jgi:hypothetical protein